MNKRPTSHLANPLNNKSFKQVSIAKLKLNKRNARMHPAAQIAKLVHNMKRFGMIVPIIVDAEYNVLAGHGRIEAAKQIGYKTVPVILIDHLTENQKRAFIIADNRISELSEWNEELLRMELSDLLIIECNGELDFDLTDIGFETAEIDAMLADIKSADKNDGIAAVDNILISAMNKPSVSQLGDLWVLGHHKLLCGDAICAESYKKLIGRNTVSLLCADAPYNVPIDGFVSGNGKTKHKEFKKAAGEMSPPQFTEFLRLFIQCSSHYLKDGALAYLFMDWRHDRELQEAARKVGLKQINLCIWDKGSGGMGSMYRSQHELVFVYKHGNETHENNIMLGKYGRYRTNVWPYPGAIRTEEGRKALQGHPTPKPVPLVMDIFKDATKIKDIVLDPFLGSGTSILAAEKTNRRCYGIEIDPHYVDLAINRWQELTGKQAVHAVTGQTFTQYQQGIARKAKVARDR